MRRGVEIQWWRVEIGWKSARNGEGGDGKDAYQGDGNGEGGGRSREGN